MRVSNKQVIMLFLMTKASASIINNLGGFSQEQRQKLVNEILVQQDHRIKELT